MAYFFFALAEWWKEDLDKQKIAAGRKQAG
jgi:hypothetical protein